MNGTSFDDGTSAAAPLWTSLVSQFDTIFHDQGLPQLGFMNDLLYYADAIAPGSFNDIVFGNNVTSFHLGGPLDTLDTKTGVLSDVTLTGFGYHAGPGYDLASGLGTPNGTLLARALTAIAHQQISFHDAARRGEPRRPRGLDQRRRPDAPVPGDVGRRRPGGRRGRPRRLRLLQQRLGRLRLDQPAGAAVAAARLRSQARHPVRQAGAGRADAAGRACQRGAGAVDRRRGGAGDAGDAEHRLRLRRLHQPGRRRARGAAGGGGGDGGRARRPDGHRAHPPERRGRPVAHALPGRRSQRRDRRAASGRCRLRGGAARAGLPHDQRRHRDPRAGLRRLHRRSRCST